MTDIRPCFSCGEFYHIDNMKCCQYDFDHYCHQCDGVLVMIENKDRERVYVHKEVLANLQSEMSEQRWIII